MARWAEGREEHSEGRGVQFGMRLPRYLPAFYILALAVVGMGCGDRQAGLQDVLPGAPEGFPLPPLDPAPAIVPYSPRPAGTITFARDVGSIIFRNCSGCHTAVSEETTRITSFEEVRDQAEVVLASVISESMPPWLPEYGYVAYMGQRGLTPTQIGIVRQWVEEGMSEGDPAEMLPLDDLINPPPVSPPILPPDAVTLLMGAGIASEGLQVSESTVYDSFILPVDVDAVSLRASGGAPGSDIQIWVLRADGSREWLLRVRSWDPLWAERYEFTAPIGLSRGSEVGFRVARLASDDSTANDNAPTVEDPLELELHLVPGADARAKLMEDLAPRIRRTG
jgi:hypothetical protein